MRIGAWFRGRTPWFQGGCIGLIVCAMLFLLHVLIYFPLVQGEYGGMLPGWVLILPFATGHAFPILSGFVVPHGFLCSFREVTCTNWTRMQAPGSVPWTLSTGEAGYCVQQTMTPTGVCAQVSEIVGFFVLVVLLFALYFAVGALLGRYLAKRKAGR